MRNAVGLGLVLVWAVWLVAPAAARAQSHLACDTYLSGSDCTRLGDVWSSSGSPLTFVASCQECSVGGADLTCKPDEQVTAAILGMRTGSGQTVAGSFSQLKLCVGSPLFSFSGALAPGEYYVMGSFGGVHGDRVLLTFSTGGSAGSDGGAVSDAGAVSGDSSGPRPGDGTGSLDSAGGSDPARTDGSGGPASGDGSSPTGTADSGGCSCGISQRATGAAGLVGPVGLVGLAGLLLLLLRDRRRRRCRCR